MPEGAGVSIDARGKTRTYAAAGRAPRNSTIMSDLERGRWKREKQEKKKVEVERKEERERDTGQGRE